MRTHTAHWATGIATLAVVACSASSGEPTASSASQAVAAGQIFNFGAIAHSGSCIDASAAGTTDGTQIQEWQCNGTGAQSFELEDAGGGAFYILNTHANKSRERAGARHRQRHQRSSSSTATRASRRASGSKTRAAATSRS